MPLVHMRVTANMTITRTNAFLRRELEDVGIVALYTTERVRPDGGGDFAPGKRRRLHCQRRRGDCGGCPDRHSEYVLGRGVVKDGDADRLARCPIAIESLGQKTSYLERALDTGLSLEACRRADNGVK